MTSSLSLIHPSVAHDNADSVSDARSLSGCIFEHFEAVSDTNADSDLAVLITQATALCTTLINEEIIKSITLNSTSPHTGSFTMEGRGKEKRIEKKVKTFN